ncbi:MAG: hypothetical protein M3320_00375 [Actinomycetota bacterium]|nr:hypothetical protein [Actinomycetota bacterium]
MSEEIRQVAEGEITQWVMAAHTSRLASYMLDQVHNPLPATPLATDDEAYRWEKCSAWTRSGLVAAIVHLVVWANIVAPQTVFEGMVVRNPPRAYYTLARAGLESAAQAVWILDQDTSSERIHRHLRLLYHDLRHMALAFEMAGDERAPAVRDRMESVRERVGNAEVFESIKRGEPKYSMIVRESAAAIAMEPAQLEVLWRSASAGAHGKNWFQHVGYTTTVGDEYEPGHFRAMLHPDPAGITRSVTAAAKLTMHGVLRFMTRAGHDPASIYPAAFVKLQADATQARLMAPVGSLTQAGCAPCRRAR